MEDVAFFHYTTLGKHSNQTMRFPDDFQACAPYNETANMRDKTHNCSFVSASA
jgi:hypothetical protein